jgi:Domain of unknown function (DU1801)
VPELKTQPTGEDAAAFLANIEDPQRREDSETVCRLMTEETGEAPVMWGSGIVGFGRTTMRYANGREAEWMAVGFAPRKANVVLYLMDGFTGYGELLEQLGKHSTGRSCLYVKRLSDVDAGVLREMVRRSYRHMSAGA